MAFPEMSDLGRLHGLSIGQYSQTNIKVTHNVQGHIGPILSASPFVNAKSIQTCLLGEYRGFSKHLISRID